MTPWTYTHAPTHERGLWILRRYGHDVGMVSLLPEVTHQTVRLQAIVDALNVADERLAKARERHPSSPGL